MKLDIPLWARLAIKAAWAVLSRVLASAGVPEAIIITIEAVLQSLGLLSGPNGRVEQLTHEEAHDRAHAIRKTCSGVACPPDLKV